MKSTNTLLYTLEDTRESRFVGTFVRLNVIASKIYENENNIQIYNGWVVGVLNYYNFGNIITQRIVFRVCSIFKTFRFFLSAHTLPFFTCTHLFVHSCVFLPVRLFIRKILEFSAAEFFPWIPLFCVRKSNEWKMFRKWIECEDLGIHLNEMNNQTNKQINEQSIE